MFYFPKWVSRVCLDITLYNIKLTCAGHQRGSDLNDATLWLWHQSYMLFKGIKHNDRQTWICNYILISKYGLYSDAKKQVAYVCEQATVDYSPIEVHWLSIYSEVSTVCNAKGYNRYKKHLHRERHCVILRIRWCSFTAIFAANRPILCI